MPVTADIRSRIAVNLDRGIAARGMTNRAVGDAIGATEHQVWRWRRGKHLPSTITLQRLADVLFDGNAREFYADDERAA